jgi:hypothetical protein
MGEVHLTHKSKSAEGRKSAFIEKKGRLLK